MHPEEDRRRLLGFLSEVAKPGRELNGIADDTNLIQTDIVDSFALIQIINYLEETHGLNLPALGIDPADLGTIGGMLDAIRRGRE